MKTRNLVLTALFAALTVIFSAISIPIPLSPVPFSLSVVAIFLAGALLPKKQAAIAQVVYLLLGIAGLPVFSEMRGGIGIIAGPTGGYLIAYPFMAWLIAFLIEKIGKRNFAAYFLSMAAGLALLYGVGTMWLSFSAALPFTAALSVGVIPFVVPDIIKAVLASLLALALYKVMAKRTAGA
jgi:biotin transport system substrate-specific component